MKKIIVTIFATSIVSACTEPAPVVSDFNGHSVKIQQSTIFTPPNPNLPGIKTEAQRICGREGKEAEYASSRSGPNNAYADHLFLCV